MSPTWLRRPLHAFVAVGLAGGLLAALPQTAHADPLAPIAGASLKPAIDPVPAPEVPPNGTAEVERGPSLATRPVDSRSVGPERLAATIPAGPQLTDRVVTAAAARLSAHGLVTDDQVDPDVRKLM